MEGWEHGTESCGHEADTVPGGVLPPPWKFRFQVLFDLKAYCHALGSEMNTFLCDNLLESLQHLCEISYMFRLYLGIYFCTLYITELYPYCVSLWFINFEHFVILHCVKYLSFNLFSYYHY